MLLGIGYLPSHQGPAFWQAFDAAAIGDDLAHIAALGFQAVRVPLFWADFQPQPERIRPATLDAFGRFLDLAHQHGLRVRAGLWTGMWDGALWWPAWGVFPAPLPPSWPLIVDGKWVRWGRVRHPCTDERMLQARLVLVRELVTWYRDHPALLGWEPLPGFGRLTAALPTETAMTWLQSTVAALHEAAPGLDASVLLAADALEGRPTLWPDEVLAAGAQPALSVATFASDRRRLPLHTGWIAFLLDLTVTLAGRPVALHLAGLPTDPTGGAGMASEGVYYAAEEEAAVHLAEVLALARQRRCPELWLWRWADIPPALWEQPPYDQAHWRRHTGLLRWQQNTWREKKLVEALSMSVAVAFPVLEVDGEAYRRDPADRFNRLWTEYQRRLS